MPQWSAILDEVPAMLLVAVRVGALLTVVPGFGSRVVPPALRLWLTLGIAVLLLPAAGHPATPVDALGTVIAVAREAAVGILLGLAVQVVLSAAQYGGRLAGAQVGFGFGGVVDPSGNEQETLLDQFQDLLALVLFLSLGGHRVVLEALARSITVAPIGEAVFRARLCEAFLQLFGNAMVTAVQIAAPVVASVTLAELAIGILSRSVPQFNIFSVGFAVRIAVGIAVFGLAVPASVLLIMRTIGTVPATLQGLVSGLAP